MSSEKVSVGSNTYSQGVWKTKVILQNLNNSSNFGNEITGALMQQVGRFLAKCENKMSRCNADAEVLYQTLILEDYQAMKITRSCCIIKVICVKFKT